MKQRINRGILVKLLLFLIAELDSYYEDYRFWKKRITHYKDKLTKLQNDYNKKLINNKKIKKKELKLIYRNSEKLKNVYKMFEFYRTKLVQTTNKMNLMKINLANQILQLILYSEMIPVLMMFKDYSQLTDLKSVFSVEEQEDFNKEFFNDVLVTENFSAMETEKDNPIFQWVNQYIALSDSEKNDIRKKLDYKSQDKIKEISNKIEKNFVLFESCKTMMGNEFREFEVRVTNHFNESKNMIMYFGEQQKYITQGKQGFNPINNMIMSSPNDQILEANSNISNRSYLKGQPTKPFEMSILKPKEFQGSFPKSYSVSIPYKVSGNKPDDSKKYLIEDDYVIDFIL
jgi:hypothetical protein